MQQRTLGVIISFNQKAANFFFSRELKFVVVVV